MESSAQISKNVEMFGVAVEKLLIKHGKHIINEQFLLNRLAQSAIDIYVSTCMVSRCSQSLHNNLSSARHEELMTKVSLVAPPDIPIKYPISSVRYKYLAAFHA